MEMNSEIVSGLAALCNQGLAYFERKGMAGTSDCFDRIIVAKEIRSNNDIDNCFFIMGQVETEIMTFSPLFKEFYSKLNADRAFERYKLNPREVILIKFMIEEIYFSDLSLRISLYQKYSL